MSDPQDPTIPAELPEGFKIVEQHEGEPDQPLEYAGDWPPGEAPAATCPKPPA